jgi:hypothetical protein
VRIESGKVDQNKYFVALSSSDGVTKVTGLSSFTVYRSRNGGAAVLYTTPTVVEISAANMPGVYALLIDEDTTIAATSDSEAYVLVVSATGMITLTIEIELYRYPVTSGQSLTVGSGAATINTAVAMTESYSALGATKTIAQALYELTQRDGNVAISGTTMTINKVDGTTPAETFTLNSATTPTAVTRAT